MERGHLKHCSCICNNLQHEATPLNSNKRWKSLLPLHQVIFDGEEAVDAGGVTKEFFLLLLKELMDPVYGMFTHYPESNLLWFSDKVRWAHGRLKPCVQEAVPSHGLLLGTRPNNSVLHTTGKKAKTKYHAETFI